MTGENRFYVFGLLFVALFGAIFDFIFVHNYGSLLAAILVNTVSLCFLSLIIGGIIFGITGLFTKRFTFVKYIQISIGMCVLLIIYIALKLI
jgi:hypothetical protein